MSSPYSAGCRVARIEGSGPWLLRDYTQPAVLIGGHLAAAILLWHWARQADPRDKEGFTRFYMRVWALFFLEYLLMPAACLAY